MSEKIMDRIAKLLAQAEHANTTEEEREAFLAKADEMMAKHMIDEAMVRAAQKPEERRKPVRVDVELYDRHSVYGVKMGTIARQVAKLVGVRMATRVNSNVVSLVGFADDVHWMQLLFTNIHMGFIGRMRPKWEQDRDFGHNLAMLRESGLSWPDVARVAANAGAIEPLPPKYQESAYWNAVDKLDRAYRKWCKDHNQEPATVTRHEAYRHTYAEAFAGRICRRLEEMTERRHSSGTGSELVLRKVQDDVRDAFYSEFPNLSPEAQRRMAGELRRQQQLDDEKHAAWLASLTPAQRLKHEKEVAAEAEKNAKLNDRYWREADKRSEKLYDSNGARAGRAAADSVNLSTSENVNKADRKGVEG